MMTVRGNIYIPEQDKDFFILLRAGMWQKVEEPLSENPDWEYIYRLASEQTVTGIVGDGIIVMGIGDKIPDEWYSRFLEDSTAIIRRNCELNVLQSRICCLLEENGIKYIVLKGQAVAQCYPKPMLRSCGDIDILLQADDFRKAIDVVKSLISRVMTDNSANKHFGFYVGDIPVEFHTNLFRGKKGLHGYLQKEQQIMFLRGGITPEFHIPFLFFHILKHLYNAGMGIRQLCDVAMAVHYHSDDFDSEELRTFLGNSLNSKLWSQSYLFCVQYLGLEQNPELAFTRVSERQISQVWKGCKISGNFGRELKVYEGKGIFGQTRACAQTIFSKFSRHWGMNKRRAVIVMFLGFSSFLKIVFSKVWESAVQ